MDKRYARADSHLNENRSFLIENKTLMQKRSESMYEMYFKLLKLMSLFFISVIIISLINIVAVWCVYDQDLQRSVNIGVNGEYHRYFVFLYIANMQTSSNDVMWMLSNLYFFIINFAFFLIYTMTLLIMEGYLKEFYFERNNSEISLFTLQ